MTQVNPSARADRHSEPRHRWAMLLGREPTPSEVQLLVRRRADLLLHLPWRARRWVARVITRWR